MTGTSVSSLRHALDVELAHPRHTVESPWARSQSRRGTLSVLRIGDSGLSLSGRELAIGEGFVQVAPGRSPSTLRVRYALAVPSARFMATLGQAWALSLGLLASVAVPALVFLCVSGSPNPAVREQSGQVFQAFQFVWEPYLFVSLASARIRHCGRHLETLIATVAYETAAKATSAST